MTVHYSYFFKGRVLLSSWPAPHLEIILSRKRSQCVEISFLVAWYDLWIGGYWDRKWKTLYLLPVPCLGIRIRFFLKDVRIKEQMSEQEWVAYDKSRQEVEIYLLNKRE